MMQAPVSGEICHGSFRDRADTDSLLSDFENSMDTLPGTPLSKCLDGETETNSNQEDARSNNAMPAPHRRDSRIRSETMLSRVGLFASVTDTVSAEDLFEYDWADSEAGSPNEKPKESYVVQELLADFLKVKSFKRKYPDLERRTMDAYERSWLQQEGLVPVGRADLGLTALRTDEVMKLLQCDYPEVHTILSDLFRRRRFQQTAELQKQQYEAARIERGEARAEAARRRAVDSASDFNHRLITDRLSNRRCYWDLQTMQIHFPQPKYSLLDACEDPDGLYPVAVIPGQFAKHFETYTPEQLMHLPLSRCIYSQPTRRFRLPPPLPTNLRYGSLEPRIVEPTDEPNDRTNKMRDDVAHKEGTIEGQDECNGTTSTERIDECATSSSPKSSTQLSVGDSKRSQIDLNEDLCRSKPSGSGTEVQCAVCKQSADVCLRCAECGHTGHPKCLDISDAMLPSVQSYQWTCMDCKRCVECHDSGHEEEMMFCDRCDRGYHAFCVGLEKIPDGKWECPLCAKGSSEKVNNKRRRSTVSRKSENSKPKRPRKSKKSLDESYDPDDEKEIKPRRKRQTRKKNVATTPSATNIDENSVTQSSLDSTNLSRLSTGEPPVKKRRGRPPLTTEDRKKRTRKSDGVPSNKTAKPSRSPSPSTELTNSSKTDLELPAINPDSSNSHTVDVKTELPSSTPLLPDAQMKNSPKPPNLESLHDETKPLELQDGSADPSESMLPTVEFSSIDN